VIVERFARLDPVQVRAVLVASHGPFAWGRGVQDAVQHAVALEFIAHLATVTYGVNPRARALPVTLLGKHFSRKHGPRAYYGQGE
jgi:L-ribulose-5-phosphate 4-epimerase